MLRASAGAGNEAVNTLHYDLIDVALGVANDPQTLADTFRDSVVPTFKALFPNTWTIDPVTIIDEKDPQDPTATRAGWTSGASVAGSKAVSGDLLPKAICGVATLRTAKIGRRARGRIFVPGVFQESEQANGLWNTLGLTVMNNYLNSIPLQPDLATGISDSTANLCVYSRTQRGADLDPYANHVTSMALRGELHWLRSRER